MARPRPSPPRGSSLLELMIAMAVIAVGLLAMWNLHMVGLTSTAAGRRHTVATALARELVSGLERLAFNDLALRKPGSVEGHYLGPGTTSGPPSSALFGALVQGDGTIRTGANEWSDSIHCETCTTSPIPGVRLDADLRERGEGGAGYERRWTVWDMTSPSAPAGSAAGVKVIAVSVIWRDPPFARPREVVLYSQVHNPGSLLAGLANSQ